jgi:restriction system protein
MEDETEIESEYFQDPEVDREWLEGDLAELQQEGRVQQQVTAERIEQMLLIQAKTGYGSVFDLISDHFPSLVTTYGREHLNGGFISEFEGPPDETDLGFGPLSITALHFDCEGIDQNAFRFYSNKDSEKKYIIHIVHKESGKRDSVSGRNLESIMKQAVVRALSLHYEYVLDKTKNILGAALERKNAIDYWDHFYVPPPVPVPALPALLEYPAKPQFNDPEPPPPTYLEYPPEPKPDSVSGFEKAYSDWAWYIKEIESENQRRYDENVAAIKNWNYERVEHEKAVVAWTERVKNIEAENQRRKAENLAAVERRKKEQIKNQQVVADIKAGYKFLRPEAVKTYCNLVLQSSDLPNRLGCKWDLEYIPQSKTLIVDHALPAPDDIVYVKKMELAEISGPLTETTGKMTRTRLNLSDNIFKQFYDETLYKICLRRFHELFETDTAGALESVVFNGWVESVDKASGNDTKACVMSVHVKKEEFQKINLARVDPKACFKALKGIGSSTLHSLTPIAPVLKINREDKRFVASYEVAGQLDERSNLAAMDWEDFEHLIRELFENEFSKPGCEVKVTQASRDGGVDSVVLDSDPIHGGKTVIQAKRYTNTVGVAAVRELYGTVLNEGAMKGILVTTADYGSDAYEFAKGKPLVLLNGANLLHLLEKHGHKAKIDIQEAKRILGEKAPVFHP